MCTFSVSIQRQKSMFCRPLFMVESEPDDESVDEPYQGIPNMMNAQYTLLSIVFLDLFGVGLVVPLLPVIVQELGLPPAFYGVLGSLYGIAQLMAAPGSAFYYVISLTVASNGVHQ